MESGVLGDGEEEGGRVGRGGYEDSRGLGGEAQGEGPGLIVEGSGWVLVEIDAAAGGGEGLGFPELAATELGQFQCEFSPCLLGFLGLL